MKTVMKTLTPAALVILSSVASSAFGAATLTDKTVPSSYFQVTAYGALGNGVHDDRPAIQAAMDAVIAAGGGTVYFPSGTYLLSTSTTASSVLTETNWTPFTMNLIGSGATLTTSLVNVSMFNIIGKLQNSLISGLTFVNTHGVTTSGTTALYFQGGGGNGTQNISIYGNTFKDFSTMILTGGVNGMLIDNNSFVMDQGKDSGNTSTSGQNYAILLHDNGANGQSIGFEITNNTYQGCGALTSLASTTSHTCGDGFVTGNFYGSTVEQNTIKGFSQNAIQVSQQISRYPGTIVSKNLIDGTMIPGDTYGGGNVGVRADANYSYIADNVITNSRIGIYSCTQTACGGSNTNAIGLQVTGNNISTQNSGTQAVYYGIEFTGVSQSSIMSNFISFTSGAQRVGTPTMGIAVNGLSASILADSVSVTGNNVTSTLPATSAGPAAISMQWATNWNDVGNLLNGFYYGFYVTGLTITQPQIDALNAMNTFTGITTSYFAH